VSSWSTLTAGVSDCWVRVSTNRVLVPAPRLARSGGKGPVYGEGSASAGGLWAGKSVFTPKHRWVLRLYRARGKHTSNPKTCTGSPSGFVRGVLEPSVLWWGTRVPTLFMWFSQPRVCPLSRPIQAKVTPHWLPLRRQSFRRSARAWRPGMAGAIHIYGYRGDSCSGRGVSQSARRGRCGLFGRCVARRTLLRLN